MLPGHALRDAPPCLNVVTVRPAALSISQQSRALPSRSCGCQNVRKGGKWREDQVCFEGFISPFFWLRPGFLCMSYDEAGAAAVVSAAAAPPALAALAASFSRALAAFCSSVRFCFSSFFNWFLVILPSPSTPCSSLGREASAASFSDALQVRGRRDMNRSTVSSVTWARLSWNAVQNLASSSAHLAPGQLCNIGNTPANHTSS